MRSFKRPVAAVLLTAAMLAVLAGEVASAVDFERIEIRLSGAAEVPTNPHGNRDRGKVTIFVPEDLFETRSETVSICFKFGRLTLTPGEPLPHAGHIHFGPAGEAGPVVLHIFGTGDGAPAPTSYPTAGSADRHRPRWFKRWSTTPTSTTSTFTMRLTQAESSGGSSRTISEPWRGRRTRVFGSGAWSRLLLDEGDAKG